MVPSERQGKAKMVFLRESRRAGLGAVAGLEAEEGSQRLRTTDGLEKARNQYGVYATCLYPSI